MARSTVRARHGGRAGRSRRSEPHRRPRRRRARRCPANRRGPQRPTLLSDPRSGSVRSPRWPRPPRCHVGRRPHRPRRRRGGRGRIRRHGPLGFHAPAGSGRPPTAVASRGRRNRRRSPAIETNGRESMRGEYSRRFLASRSPCATLRRIVVARVPARRKLLRQARSTRPL